MVSAQSGRGKTAAFMMPVLHCLSEATVQGGRSVQVLVLTLKRELAMQVSEAAGFDRLPDPRSRVWRLWLVACPMVHRSKRFQRESMKATPSRLMDHIQSKRVGSSTDTH
jgi:superfamily II DNA/RNA helicase